MAKKKKNDYKHSKKFKRFLHDEEMRLKNSVIKIFAVFFLILIGINSYQLIKLSGAFSEVKAYNQGVVEEVGQMKEGLMNFGNDLNEIRSYLYLPTREYFIEQDKKQESDEDTQTSSETSQALYKLMSDLAEEKKKTEAFENHCDFIQELHENETFVNQMGEENLTLSELVQGDEVCSFKLSSGDLAIYNLVASQSDRNGLLIQSALGQQQMTLSEDTEQKVVDYLQQNAKKVIEQKQKLNAQQAKLTTLLQSQEVINVLREKQLNVELEATENEEWLSYWINDADDSPVGEIQIDRSVGDYRLDGSIYPTSEALKPALMEHLETLNLLPESQKQLNEKRDELEAIFREKAFESLLQQSGLTLTRIPREEGQQLIYDLKDDNKQTVLSIMLHKNTGEYRLLQGDQESDLLSLLLPTGEEKKNLTLPDVLPEFGDSPKDAEGITMLVAGKHGSLVDTMMIVRLAGGKISVVSVPRDLYWNGRKINSVYAFYGMEELVRVLSQLSGYQIDHYALIDMYAFIDVVEIIGCLDVTLEHDLIDPTYKTEDDGVWGTLYYPAGPHHLCGKQSLRVARSRHTTSDFSRAERQQLILEALKEKAREIGLKDARKLKSLAEAVLKYVETDLNAAQMMGYYFRFKDFEMNRGYVLSSGNVLESTFTGELNGSSQTCTTKEETGEETCKAGNKGAYILLPRNGNWNNLKWYFHQAFEENGEGL